MEQITYAFAQSVRKRSRNHLIMMIPLIYMLVGQAAVMAGLPGPGVLALAAAAAYGVFRVKRRSLPKAIRKALRDPAQEDAFLSSIGGELRRPSAKTWKDESDRLYLFVTDSWLVLVTPNGSRICRKQQIRGVGSIFSTSSSRMRLELSYTDWDPESFPYPELEEPLCDLLNLPYSG